VILFFAGSGTGHRGQGHREQKADVYVMIIVAAVAMGTWAPRSSQA